MMEITATKESDTRALGLRLGREAEAGQIIALIGDLGTGKTALTRYIAEGLGVRETITSPTFTIVKEYHSGRIPLYHFDVYRVSDPDELFEIGAQEYFEGDGLCVIEWADLILDCLPADAMVIHIRRGEQEEERTFQCEY